jgi:phasin family protein
LFNFSSDQLKKVLLMSKSPFPNPFEEFAKLASQFKVPGVDVTALIAARKSDFDALTELNRSAVESAQAIAAKQSEAFAQSLQSMQRAATDASKGAIDPAKGAQLAQAAYNQAVANAKELAEISQKAQADALAIVQKRASEQIQELQKLYGQKK